MTKHPAKFTDVIVEEIAKSLPETIDPLRILDPFAGTGRIHLLQNYSTMYQTIGVEIEPEWAEMHPHTVVGNALELPFEDNYFDCIATSPCYGNRMADAHDAQERCKACKGTGAIQTSSWRSVTCEKCEGLGRRKYVRMTYTHQLGRKLHPDNSGQMQWGEKYRRFHEKAWTETARVLRPGGMFVLNCSDHFRAGVRQRVTRWHVEFLHTIGFGVVDWKKIKTPRMRRGENHHLRVEREDVVIMVKSSKEDVKPLFSPHLVDMKHGEQQMLDV